MNHVIPDATIIARCMKFNRVLFIYLFLMEISLSLQPPIGYKVSASLLASYGTLPAMQRGCVQ